MISAEVGVYIEIDGLKTFYIKQGSGPALVLIHGGSPGACTTVNWGANIEFLAEAGFTVYAFDEAGYGRTDNPEDYSLDYRVAHAQGFVNAMALGRYSIMGNSQGSYIAARMALEDARVQKLALVASGTLAPPGSASAEHLAREHAERLRSYQPSPENMRDLTMQTLYNKERVTPELIQERYLMSIGKNRDAEDVRRKAAPPKQIRTQLGNITIPTLILWGAQDSGAAPERGLLLQQSIPGSELHVFDRCGHWVQWDQQERFQTVVRDFLRGD